jgi:hypothetical protein
MYRFMDTRYPNLTLTPSQMLGFFRMTPSEDPCNRGNTILTGNSVSNAGQSACQISLTVPALGGLMNVQVGFDVPLEVRAQVSKEAQDYIFQFSPSQAQHNPAFWITNDALNRDWGGTMQQFSYGPSRIVVDTGRGCIRYHY